MISGTVPQYDYSTTRFPQTAVTATGAFVTSGLAPGGIADEPLGDFFERAVGVLSGIVDATSGVQLLQQELAVKAAQLQVGSRSNAAVLTYANALIAASGEAVIA